MILNRRSVVGFGGEFWGLVPTEIDVFPVVTDSCDPTACPLVKRDSLEPRLVVLRTRDISLIFSSGTYPEVSLRIVELVAVNVINFKPFRAPENFMMH